MKSLGVLLGITVASISLVTHAQTQFPLKVDIDVSTKRTKQNLVANSAADGKIDQVQVRVKIDKSGGQAYTDKLTAELYIIGRLIHSGDYGIIDVVKGDFTFTEENKNTFEFTTKAYPLSHTAGNLSIGGTYETYLLVVVDHEGNIIDSRSGRVIGEKGIAFIRELGPKTLFDRDGNVLGYIDTEKAKKLVPPPEKKAE